MGRKGQYFTLITFELILAVQSADPAYCIIGPFVVRYIYKMFQVIVYI
jgi:hypothetical protein